MGKQQNERRKLDDCDDNDEFYLLGWMIKNKKIRRMENEQACNPWKN